MENMYEFHYDYMKEKYAGGVGTAYADEGLSGLPGPLSIRAQLAGWAQGPSGPLCLWLCYMDTDSLVYHIKTKDFYIDILDDVEERFDTSGYSKEDARPLPIRKNKKVIGLMKDELGGAIMTEFVALRPKLYSYIKLDGMEEKKCKGIKKCVVKKTLTFEDYKACLFDPGDSRTSADCYL